MRRISSNRQKNGSNRIPRTEAVYRSQSILELDEMRNEIPTPYDQDTKNALDCMEDHVRGADPN